MSKRSQRVLASATVLSLVMSTVAMAAPTAGTAVSGSSRVDTAVAIAKQVYTKWTDSKVAVIANGADAHLVDALTVAPLAAQKKAPIFLTLGTTTLEDSVVSALKAQGVTTVYVVGGTVTTDVDAQLKAAGVTAVTHLAGATRFETAKAINTELEKAGAPAAYAVVNTNASVADALSIAAEAAKQNIEIVLASDANSVPVDLTGKKVYAVGGTGVLSDALVTKLNATRLAGANRFATNAAVLQGLDKDLDYTTTYVADGTDAHLVDSLPGSVLAAQTGSPIVLVSDTVAPEVTSVLTGKVDKMTTVTPLGGAVSKDAVAGVVNPTTATPAGDLKVTSVTATSADSFKVVFNQTPADTSKVTFTVQRETTPVAVTPTWNGSEATVTGSAKFAQGNYTVAVKEGDKDLGTSKLTYEQEKVAKIEINSDTLATQTVTIPAAGGAPATSAQYAYFTYKVYNQYNVDITDSNLASIQWIVPSCNQLGGTSKGTVKVQAVGGLNLFNLGTMTITGIENNDHVTTSKSLKVSATQGTLSDITFNALKQVDNKDFKAGSTAEFYIDYTAKDMAGNETKDYDLVSQGLSTLTSSSTNDVSVALENNDGKAEIKVKVLASSVQIDMPILFTAVTTSGKSTQFNSTLKKQAAVANFTLLAPTEDIASGDGAKEIPFIAYDQDGSQVTSFDDLVDDGGVIVGGYKYITGKNFSVSPALSGGSGLYFVKRNDGSAKLMYQPAAGLTQDATQILSASTTTTGKYSQLSLTVRKPAVASSFTIDTAALVTKFQSGAAYDIDNDDFTIKDQYGRKMDVGANAFIRADITTPVGSTAFQLTDATAMAYGRTATNLADDFVIQAPTPVAPATSVAGSYSVKFTLNDGTGDVTSKTLSFSVLDDGDIKGLTTGTVGKLYTTHAIAAPGDVNNTYRNTVQIFGKTSDDQKVVLNNTRVNFDLGKSNDTIDTVGILATTAPCDFNKVALTTAHQFDAGVTSGDSAVTVTTVIGTDVRSTSFTVTTSSEAPVAQSVKADDELDNTDAITDDVEVLDQYGKNLLKRADWDSYVTIYNNGVKVTKASLPAANASVLANLTIGNLGNAGDIINIVTANGKTASFAIK